MKKENFKIYFTVLDTDEQSCPIAVACICTKKGQRDIEGRIQGFSALSGNFRRHRSCGAGGYLLGGDILSSEIIVQTNLKNRFLPVVEIGYGKTDVINDANDMHYKTSAPYFRIGMDYNVFYQKPYLPGYLYVGLRYGMSSFTYDASGPDMTDPNYGDI